MEPLIGTREFKNNLYQQFARIGKCLSSDKRLELLHLLSQGPKSVEQLAIGTGSGIANISKHLHVMADAKLIKNRKQGTFVFYELSEPAVAQLLHALWQISEYQLSELRLLKENFSRQLEDIQTLSLNELLKKMRLGQVTLIDVRPKDEFEYAHIPGAISLPIEELEVDLSALPKNTEIVAYCRGPYCVYAAKAARVLLHHGFKAFRMEEGVHEWRLFNEGILQGADGGNL
jgi:rhodanese-related sulfurtransferase/DNA-binding transcriptional ArsR family regulator